MENNTNHLLDILRLINNLQKNVICQNNNDTCTRPVLGLNNVLSYNTRPVSFYLCNNQELTITYSEGTSSIFRVENINGNCITVRLLTTNETGDIVSTNEFATINISCIAAISCLNDVSLTL